MAMKTLFLLFVPLTLSGLGVQSSANFSSPILLASNTTFQSHESGSWMDKKNETLINSQSDFDLRNDQGNRTATKVELNCALSEVEMLKLRFERAQKHLFNDSNSLLVFNLNNNSRPILYDELEKSVALLMKYNDLSTFNAKILQCCRFLIILRIDNNNLFTLPIDAFQNLRNLQTIVLNKNNFISIPENLFVHNRKLKTVKLIENKTNLTRLPSNLFGGFSDLEVLWLKNVGLEELPENLLWKSYRLMTVDLSKNFLKILPKNLLKDTHELRSLNLSSNHLTTLPKRFFFAVTNLYELDLSKNYITTISSSDMFVSLGHLRRLNMENNGLESVHADAFISLSRLAVAHFSHNLLNLSTGLYNDLGQFSPFRHCLHLETLNLSHNNISEVFTDWIIDHTELRLLDLSYNNFYYLEMKNLQFKSNDLDVNLTYNFIKIVNLTQEGNFFESPNSKRYVLIDLNNNPIDCYCDVYSLVTYVSKGAYNEATYNYTRPYVRLKVDHLSCNAPEKLRGKLLKELYHAELTCSIQNGRSAICASGGACDCYIVPQYAVLYLNCDRRSLTEAPVWINHWNIVFAYLNFSSNFLKKTPNMNKGGYEKIGSIRLDLSKNQIDRIEEYSVHPNLYFLDLNYNKLTRIDWTIILPLWGLTQYLSMRENPWSCNKDILTFRDKLQEHQKTSWDMMYFACNDTLTAHPSLV